MILLLLLQLFVGIRNIIAVNILKVGMRMHLGTSVLIYTEREYILVYIYTYMYIIVILVND